MIGKVVADARRADRGSPVAVTRIGTQVVVRLRGQVGDGERAALDAAYDEVRALVSTRVAVDLEEAEAVEGAGLDFLVRLHATWQVRLLNAPAGLRTRLSAVG